jgi:galactose-1-phosphate uridylyltransferase
MSQKHEDATTSEMRHDWLADRWVIIAPQRSERPQDFLRSPPKVLDSIGCPFCQGREHETPQEVAVYRGKRYRLDAAGSPVQAPRWHVRVVPNKFPAVRSVSEMSLEAITQVGSAAMFHPTAPPLSPADDMQLFTHGSRGLGDGGLGSHLGCGMVTKAASGGLETAGTIGLETSAVQQCAKPAATSSLPASGSIVEMAPVAGVDLFRRRDLTGGHEVIVESPDHLHSISQLDRETTRLVFQAYRDRLAYWLETRGLAYAVVFKNVGQDAGASLSHTHSQLIATDILPTDVERMAKRMVKFVEQEGECLFCRMQNDEREQGSRIVEQTKDFIAFCPFASRLPSLVTIVPKQHQSAFEDIQHDQLDQLSWLMHRLVRRIENVYPDAAYNFIIHTAPRMLNGWGRKLAAAYHWRIELFPRLTTVAGFEWGSDCYINPIAPEVAATSLRTAGV